MGAEGTRVYGPKYSEALAYAADLHALQMRKSDEGRQATIPYLAHLLEVSALVWFGGGDETQAIAGLLHDSLEDCYPIATPDVLQELFGAEVRDIVLACSDGTPGAPRGSEGYVERKGAYLAHLYDTDVRALLVTVADKVSNAQAIIADHEHVGDILWRRFNNPPETIAWYYIEVGRVATGRLPGNVLTQRLTGLATQIASLAGLASPETDVAGRSPFDDVEALAIAKSTWGSSS